jgi:hypothetical protein
MNKKALIGILAVAVVAICVMTIAADTWVDVLVPVGFTADPAATQGSSGVSIGLYQDCALTIPVLALTNPTDFRVSLMGGRNAIGLQNPMLPLPPLFSHDFGMVSEGNTYEWAFYVVNNGSKQVYITYLPTTFSFDGGQTSGKIVVTVIAYGLPCETAGNLSPPLCPNQLPYNLPEKDPAHPLNGFLLMPDKVIKLDVKLTINSIMADQTYGVAFEIAGVSVTVQV